MDVNNLCALRPESTTYQQLYIAKEPVIFLLPGVGEGRAANFCCDNGALTWSLLKAYCFAPPPPPLSSIPATTKSQTKCTICKQVTSILILTSHLIWTELSHTDRWKQSHCRSLPSHCRILPHILNLLICGPVTFIFGTTRYRLCSQTLWCVGNNDIE